MDLVSDSEKLYRQDLAKIHQGQCRFKVYKLVARFYPEFERVYAERTQERYGFWRPIIPRAVERFLDCGDLKKRFARVRCPKCRHELFVVFSCRGRCVCPSCHQKRVLEKAVWVAQEVCAEVAHRRFVFTIPKRLRIYFRYDRSLLGELCHRFPNVLSCSTRSAKSIMQPRLETKCLSITAAQDGLTTPIFPGLSPVLERVVRHADFTATLQPLTN